MQATFISETVGQAEVRVDGDRLLVAPAALPAAVGWELKPEGLCRGDVCVPARLDGDGEVDITAIAAALGRAVVVDAAAGLVAMALDGEDRRRAITSLEAPTFTLPDLEGRPRSLAEWRDRKKLLLAFSSW